MSRLLPPADVAMIAIDPGSEYSAFAAFDGDGRIVTFSKVTNEEMLQHLLASEYGACVIEQIRGYGLRVGNEVFDTCVWSGRFAQATGADCVTWMPRKTVSLNLCGIATSGDKYIRQAVLDRFGGKDTALGNKKAPGPLYGCSKDCWAAVAVGLTWLDQRQERAA